MNKNNNKISVKNIEVSWDLTSGQVNFADTPVAMLWIDSTLAHLMSGVQSMVGTERFQLALQNEGRNSVEDDWNVISSAENFEQGFKNISDIATVAGWGRWQLVDINHKVKSATFRATNTWEGLYQRSIGKCWGSAMLAGKFSGYVCRLFEGQFWSEQTKFIAKGDPYDEFQVSLSEKTIEQELETLLKTDKATQADMAVALNQLRQEVQSRRIAEAEVKKLAYYDPLTDLPNRRYLTTQFEQDLSFSRINQTFSAIMFIDLDHFKSINDSLGHASGDQLLIQVSSRIKGLISSEDTLARIGGDEFILFLQNLSSLKSEAISKATEVATQIVEVISLPYLLNESQYNITGSIGIRIVNPDSSNVEEHIKQADIALYRAKQAGKNQFCFFSQEMQDFADKIFEIRHELKQAVENNQFEVYYQPQFDHKNNIIGVEALVRWIHPEKGIVPASDFIPLAEEHGLITAIGKSVLHQSLIALNRWDQSGLPESFKHIAINISAKQFNERNFVKETIHVLNETQVNPNLVIFEITESLLLENIEVVITKINQLKKIGVRFSLDDFGTGFSSLSYLTKLPIDELKIDRSFISSLPHSEQDAVIVKTIISMAKYLKLQVVAEGVEQEKQLNFLKDCGCKSFQGYLMSKPVQEQGLAEFGLNKF